MNILPYCHSERRKESRREVVDPPGQISPIFNLRLYSGDSTVIPAQARIHPNDGVAASSEAWGWKTRYCAPCHSVSRRAGKETHLFPPRVVLIFLLAALSCALFGCSAVTTGFFRFATLDPPDQIMQQHFSHAVAQIDDRGQVCCVLTATPDSISDQPSPPVRQMLVVRTFWLPRRGRTPVSPSSTNVNIDYLIETDGQAALYRGAGFATLSKITSKHDINLNLRSAQIRLERQSTGFRPSFIAAELSGSVVLVNDPPGAQVLFQEFDSKFQELIK